MLKSHFVSGAVLLILIGQFNPIHGQAGSEYKSPEHAFDFWLGDWELAW